MPNSMFVVRFVHFGRTVRTLGAAVKPAVGLF
jgi:hypothetical protein